MSRSWKRSDGMSYREWGRVRMERVLVDDWKNQLLEEQEMNSVFVVINEWEDEAGSGAEVTGGRFFTSESDAWDALKVIADTLHMHLSKDSTSLLVKSTEDEYESYYIQELERG